jgi:Fe/S biogenesis protein NfuA
MIEITQSAEEYFAKLIKQQEMDDIGLHLSVMNPGTPSAACDLQFHVAGEAAANGSGDLEKTFEYDSFNLYVPHSSERWLTDAKIDFEKDDAGGQLTIKAPGIKGNKPDDNAGLIDKINWILTSEINPGLASHGGMVSLEQITPEMDVILRFGGGCHGCGMANVTLKEGIEKTLKEHFPEINAVVDATDHASGDNPYYK